MLRLLIRSTGIVVGICCLLIGAGVLLGQRLGTTILAIDPLYGYTRDIALLDVLHNLTVPLAQTAADERTPVWSPDGRQLAYLSIEGGMQTLWVLDANGHHRVALHTAPSGDPQTAALAWSPLGDTIAFTALAGNRQAIFTLNLLTGEQRQITATGASASSPAWSPDGHALAFAWSLVANQEIFIADVNSVIEPLVRSTEVERVTSDYGMDAMPAWSPDGEYIAFFSTRDGNSNIYVYDVDAGDLLRITDDAARDIAPVWAPDGSALLYRSFKDRVWATYRVEADCMQARACRPTRVFEGDYSIAWRP